MTHEQILEVLLQPGMQITLVGAGLVLGMVIGCVVMKAMDFLRARRERKSSKSLLRRL